MFQTQIIWFKRIHNLKYLRSTTFGSKDIVIRKSEFVAKTQFLCFCLIFYSLKILPDRIDINAVLSSTLVTSPIYPILENILSLNKSYLRLFNIIEYFISYPRMYLIIEYNLSLNISWPRIYSIIEYILS